MNDSYFIFLLFFFSFSSSFSFSDAADRFVPCLRSSFLYICEKPANRSRQFADQTVKKVRNRQNQSTNKKCFTESKDWILRSVFSIKPTDSVIARRAQFLRPTRQSLTMRFVIPKRNMVARNDAANLMFFIISIPFCFVLPCFATGFHTFGFKIATAALRPRNDTKLIRFLLAAQEFGCLSSEQICSLPANRSRQFAGQFYFSSRARACLLARCSCRP